MKNFVAGISMMTILVLLGVSAPLICPASPLEVNMSERLQGVSWQHPMGTDQLGRDLFSRIPIQKRF